MMALIWILGGVVFLLALGAAFMAGRAIERIREVKEWEDIDRAWDDLAHGIALAEQDMPDPPLLAQPPGEFDPGDWARIVASIAEMARDRPIHPDGLPCPWHGSHAADERCDPPDDTDFLANSGILFHVHQLEQLADFRQWLERKIGAKLSRLRGRQQPAPAARGRYQPAMTKLER
jgi:hypothetical protein